MSENSNKPNENINSDQSYVSVPLSGDNKPTAWQIGGVCVFLICIFLCNFLISHHTKDKGTEPEKEEVYNTEVTPLSQNAGKNAKSNDSVDLEKKQEVAEAQAQALAKARAQDFQERLESPQLAVGGDKISTTGNESMPQSNGNVVSESNGLTMSPSQAAKIADPSDPNTLFLSRASNSLAERAQATHFGPLPLVIGQGKFIKGTLETAINSDLSGQVRAIVQSDVYGEQGDKILIPKGSRLIGEYKSGLVNNQSRLFVVWNRVLEPNGVDVPLGSEGTDPIGRAGLTGDVDYHYLARFGGAALTSILSATAANAGVSSYSQYNSASAYRQQLSAALGEQASNMLNQSLNIPPTINIDQGTEIAIFVNKDLDFSHVFKV